MTKEPFRKSRSKIKRASSGMARAIDCDEPGVSGGAEGTLGMVGSGGTGGLTPYRYDWLRQFLPERFLRRQIRIGDHRDLWLAVALLFALASLFVAHVSRMHTVTHDAFHEMALVRLWFQTGQFPLGDVFAFTPTVHPAVHHEWGTGLILFLAAGSSPLGLVGMAWLKWTAIAGLWVMMYRVARQNGAHPILFACMSLIAFPMLWVGFATVRAGLFTMCAIAAQLLMQQSDARGGRRWIALWIPMYLAWLNIHAGFVVGVAMLALHGVERSIHAFLPNCPTARIDSDRGLLKSTWLVQGIHRWWMETWHLLALIPILLSGLLINPWGWDYVPYLVRAITMPRPTMLEWNPLWCTHDPVTTLLAYGLCVTCLVYCIWTRRVGRLSGILICLLAAIMALKHIRHGALFGVLWISLAPGWLTATPLGRSWIRCVMNHRLAWIRGSMALALIAWLFSIQSPFYAATVPDRPSATGQCYPVNAIEFLRASSFAGKLLTPFDAGAFASWELHPRVKVSIDGRYEVAYQEHVLPEHNRFYRALEGWERVPQEFGADAMLIPTRAPIFRALTDQPDRWEVVYRDDCYAVAKSVTKLP